MSILLPIDHAFLRRVSGASVARPGEYADLFVERASEALLSRAGGAPESPRLGAAEGAAARVFEAGTVRHVAVGSLHPSSIESLPSRLRGAPDSMPVGDTGGPRGSGDPVRGVDPVRIADQHPMLATRSIDAAGRHLAAIETAVGSRLGAGAVRIGSKMEIRAQSVAVATSEGEVRGEERSWISFSTRIVVEAGVSVAAGGGALDLERLRALHPPDELAALLERAVQDLKEEIPAPSGEVSVVLGPGAGGILIHEACGHALEGDRALRGRSALVELLGEKVGPGDLTVIDDPTLAGLAGSRAIDDEGWPSARNVLIDSGRLVGLLLDRTTALLAATTPTGSARRESYRHLPMPRMSNTFVLEGRYPPEEIVASVPRGVYIAELGAGEVDTVSADFSFRVARGYLIASGRRVAPLRPFVVRGNGLRVLRGIKMIGRDLRFDSGAGECGKEGQRSRASVGQPTLKVAGLTAQPIRSRESGS